MGEVTTSDIRSLQKDIGGLYQKIDQNMNMVAGVNANVSEIKSDLAKLQHDFNAMIESQKKTASVQRAMTELVRVRQELEQNFGNYKLVRETMLGVLQATDSALVKETTISRVSEELMLSTPKYWLAPVLVAVSAWITNNRDLAERAIAEAAKRDEERTALTMALICRRCNRLDTCHEWLNIYFSKQSGDNFSEANYTYLNAYINGVFGPDRNHLCDDYVGKWLNEVKGNRSNFEADQERIWKDYCNGFTKNVFKEYPLIQNNIVQSQQIQNYLGRIYAVDDIQQHFGNIKGADIDTQKLKKDIDDKLVALIKRYDKDEESLRIQERRFQMIKDHDGDVTAADEMIRNENMKRQREALDMVEQMTGTIVSGREVHPSEKKTALSFLGNYIQKGYNNYITEAKAAFPNQVTLCVDDWKGMTENGQNAEALYGDYRAYMENQKSQELSRINTNKPTFYLVGAIASVIVALILFIVAGGAGVIGLGVAVFCGMKMFSEKKNIEQMEQSIHTTYTRKVENGVNTIYQTILQWNSARQKVIEFNNQPVREIIV